jgi:hypothetical protein
MKKIFYVLLAAIAITSCSSDNDTLPTKPDEQSTEQPTKEPTEEPVVNPIENPTTPTVETKGEFVIDNVTYDITDAVLTTMAMPKNTTEGQIYLGSNKTPIGAAISLAINYETDKKITGTYNIGKSYEDVGVLQSKLTSYLIVKKSPDGSTTIYSNGEDKANLKEGSVTITENSEKNFSVKYNLLFENGITASGNTTLNFITNRR